MLNPLNQSNPSISPFFSDQITSNSLKRKRINLNANNSEAVAKKILCSEKKASVCLPLVGDSQAFQPKTLFQNFQSTQNSSTQLPFENTAVYENENDLPTFEDQELKLAFLLSGLFHNQKMMK